MISPSQQDENDRPGSGPDPSCALASAEAALSRIQRCAEDAQRDRITPGEAVDQILDELAACSILGRVRRALSRSFSPAAPN
jgi:hypothetical protein